MIGSLLYYLVGDYTPLESTLSLVFLYFLDVSVFIIRNDAVSGLSLHDSCRGSYNSSVMGNIFKYETLGTYHRIVSYFYRSQNSGSCTDSHVVSNGRMPLTTVFPGSPQSNSVVHADVIANLSSFSDYDAVTVVYEKPFSYCCPRMYLYISLSGSSLRNPPGQEIMTFQV